MDGSGRGIVDDEYHSKKFSEYGGSFVRLLFFTLLCLNNNFTGICIYEKS